MAFSSLQAVAIRLAKLTSSGAPSPGASNAFVSDALIDVGASVEVTSGDDFEIKNGGGVICASFKDCDRIKRLNLSMTLCQLDAYLLEFLTGAQVFESAGLPIGWQYPAASAACPNGVSLEVWTKAWNGSQQAAPAFTSSAAAYWHWVFPRVKMVQGDITLDNNLLTVPLNGTSEENSAITANGPFNDWPAAVAGQGGITRVGGVFLDATLPTVTGAKIAVPSGS